jgi:hypothetical protein
MGGAAYARNDNPDEAIGNAWRHLYRCYVEGTLDEQYQKEVLDADAIQQGLADGLLLRDERLSNALTLLIPSARIDHSPHARAIWDEEGPRENRPSPTK